MSGAVFYVAAMSEQPDGGIYRYEMRESAAPEQVGFTPVPNANYIAFSPDGKYMYTTCSVEGEGGVASFRIASDGSLAPINTCAAGGRSTCYVITDHSGTFLYAANYSTGTFAEFKLDNGRIVERTQLIQHEGKGPNVARQECAHPHFTGLSPDGRYLCVIDLGIDAIKAYPIDPVKGLNAAGVITSPVRPAGSGPRHLVFDRSGKIAYLLNELGNTVISCRYADGRFEAIETRSTLPALVNVATKAAAVRLSADERYLFASNRGFDSIAVFRLDGKGGMERTSLVLSGGSSPRDINFLPGGKMFAAANEFSDVLVFFDYDGEGGLTPNGLIYKLPRPLCVMWR